jgi:NitT/TauT family transport system substrate-binding protein
MFVSSERCCQRVARGRPAECDPDHKNGESGGYRGHEAVGAPASSVTGKRPKSEKLAKRTKARYRLGAAAPAAPDNAWTSVRNCAILRMRHGNNMLKHIRNGGCAVATLAILLAWSPAALAEDVLKLAVGHQGAWDSAVPELGQKAGIFKKHGIVLELTYVTDNAEADLPAMAQTDVGVGINVMGVFRAYAKGEPVRIIGASSTGSANYWYVPSTSNIKVVKDISGRTIAYPTRGEESRYDVFDFMKYYRLRSRPVASAGGATTLKDVLAGKIDVGWASPPFGIDAIEDGQIRAVARANDVPTIKDKTLRVIITSPDRLQKSKPVLSRFMLAYRETVDWMYSDSGAIKGYAEYADVSESLARRVRDEFYTKNMLLPDKISGLKTIVKEAASLHYTRQQLAKGQLNELIQVVASPAQVSVRRPLRRPRQRRSDDLLRCGLRASRTARPVAGRHSACRDWRFPAQDRGNRGPICGSSRR